LACIYTPHDWFQHCLALSFEIFGSLFSDCIDSPSSDGKLLPVSELVFNDSNVASPYASILATALNG
jgi:hypothetical protein